MQYQYIEHEDNDLELKSFLLKNDLCMQKEYEWGYKVFDSNQLVACGFVQGHLLMMVAISKEYRHQGILQKLMLKLFETCMQKNIDPIYLFTKREHISSFKACGLFTIIDDEVSMMSNDKNILDKQNIKEYLVQEKWPYSYYFCKNTKEYKEYKNKIQEKLKYGN